MERRERLAEKQDKTWFDLNIAKPVLVMAAIIGSLVLIIAFAFPLLLHVSGLEIGPFLLLVLSPNLLWIVAPMFLRRKVGSQSTESKNARKETIETEATKVRS
jgi:hypothetical protein